ncbi:SRPBCC domain-containing protein [Streptomyces uncialis]|uniref:SRPBCC family protein n=1 Tax=Streptomyces uncialis TaxID=1048205 RepID=UPI003647DC24
MPHPFELRKEITLDATSEEVWDAIATGPGIDSWFMGHNEVTPGEGGRNGMDLGGHVQESTVTAWQPPLRFAHRSAEADDGSFMAMEFLVEGRDQGSTVLRLVQSGVLGDDWETEYEAMAVGWDMYLHTLAAYLTHFPGRTAAPVGAFRPGAAAPERAWAVLKEALGLPDRLTEGDAVRLAVPGGGAPVEGVVDYLAAPTFLGVRTADGLYRFIHSGPDRGNVIVLGHHVFDADAADVRIERSWKDWLAALAF